MNRCKVRDARPVTFPKPDSAPNTQHMVVFRSPNPYILGTFRLRTGSYAYGWGHFGQADGGQADGALTAKLTGAKLTGLRTPSIGYKPFRYPWAYEFWRRQQQVHWMPEEVPLGEDVKDWASKLNDQERNLLTQIFRFFTQSDVEVNDNYMERYARVFKPTEIKMMLAAFSNIETVHIAAYALLLETIGMPEIRIRARSWTTRRCATSTITCRDSASTPTPTFCAPWRCSAASPKACSCSRRSRC